MLYQLNISRRHYCRLKEYAISLPSLRLWSAPSANLDLRLALVSMLIGGTSKLLTRETNRSRIVSSPRSLRSNSPAGCCDFTVLSGRFSVYFSLFNSVRPHAVGNAKTPYYAADTAVLPARGSEERSVQVLSAGMTPIPWEIMYQPAETGIWWFRAACPGCNQSLTRRFGRS